MDTHFFILVPVLALVVEVDPHDEGTALWGLIRTTLALEPNPVVTWPAASRCGREKKAAITMRQPMKVGKSTDGMNIPALFSGFDLGARRQVSHGLGIGDPIFFRRHGKSCEFVFLNLV